MKKITSSRQIAAVRKRMRGETETERLLHRLHCAVSVMAGRLSASEVARIYGDSPRAVAYWVTRFVEHGVAGLQEEKRLGRTPALNAANIKRLAQFVSERRAKSESVTGPVVADFIERSFAVRLTVRQCWRILKRLTP